MTLSSSTPIVSVIIVSWNVAALLEDCLTSILADPVQAEIIVVDSGSSDATVAMVRTNFPQVRLLAQQENVGYTRGNNIGLHEARGRYLLLLNPDTIILDEAITKMAAYLDNHAEVGIVGPHTLNTDGTTQSTRRRFPTLMTGIFESTWLQGYAPKRLLDNFYLSHLADDGIYEVDWVQGSCLMLRREVYDQIGGLDEGFRMYSEELDFCRRAKAAGWRVIYHGGARIVHYGGKSSEQAGAYTHLTFQRSKLRYFRKYGGVLQAAALRVILIAQYVYQWLLEAGKRLLGHKVALRRQRMHTYGQVIRGLLTPG